MNKRLHFKHARNPHQPRLFCMRVTAPGITCLRLLCALTAATCSLLTNQVVYRNTPVTTDENSYVFQANLFLEGRIARPFPPPHVAPVFASEMIICDPGVGWLSRYPPAHALWLAPGVILGQPRFMVALAAGLAVWFLSASVMLLGAAGGAACLLLLFSPYFQFMHGTLLSHTSGLAVVSVMWWAYLRWQTGGHAGHAALAGAMWAFFFLNRTYTGALIALPLGLDALVRLAFRCRQWSQWRATFLFAITAAAGVGFYLLYNYLALGDPFKSTYLFYDDPWKIGFSETHRLKDGLGFMVDNLRLLDRWLFGVPGGLALLLAAVALGWSSAWTPVCLGCTLAVVLGYVAFNYPGFNTCGPYYYFETLPFIVTLVALAAARLQRWRWVRNLVPLMAVLLGISGLTFMWHEGARMRRTRADETNLQAAIRQAPPASIVFVGEFREEIRRNLLLNARGLQSLSLVVFDWGPENYWVTRSFPGRDCYRIAPGAERLVSIQVPWQRILYNIPCHTMRNNTGRKTTLTDSAQIVTEAKAGRDPANFMAWGKHLNVLGGRYRVSFQVSYANVLPAHPLLLDVATQGGRKILASGALHGSASTSVVNTLDFTIFPFGNLEPRVFYGGSGDVILRAVRVEEL